MLPEGEDIAGGFEICESAGLGGNTGLLCTLLLDGFWVGAKLLSCSGSKMRHFFEVGQFFALFSYSN